MLEADGVSGGGLLFHQGAGAQVGVGAGAGPTEQDSALRETSVDPRALAEHGVSYGHGALAAELRARAEEEPRTAEASAWMEDRAGGDPL